MVTETKIEFWYSNRCSRLPNCILFKYVHINSGERKHYLLPTRQASIIYYQQHRQCKCDVTLKSVPATIVAVEKQ